MIIYRKDFNVVLMNTSDFSVARTIEWDKAINNIVLSPNNRSLALNGDVYTNVYDLTDYSLIQSFKTQSMISHRLVLFPFFSDNHNIMTADGDEIKKFHMNQMKEHAPCDSDRPYFAKLNSILPGLAPRHQDSMLSNFPHGLIDGEEHRGDQGD